MTANWIFVNAALLDGWVAAGRVDVVMGAMTVRGTGERFVAAEAVHVLADATSSGDPRGWVGEIHLVADLVALGAEVLDRSLVVQDLAYDVDPGFLITPAAGPARRAALVTRLSDLSRRLDLAQSDEELLARYLIRKL